MGKRAACLGALGYYAIGHIGGEILKLGIYSFHRYIASYTGKASYPPLDWLPFVVGLLTACYGAIKGYSLR